MTARVGNLFAAPPTKPTDEDFPGWLNRKLAVKYVKFLGFPNITENSLRYAWKVVGDLPRHIVGDEALSIEPDYPPRPL